MSNDGISADLCTHVDDQLAQLIARQGWEPFVSAALVPPTPEAFPEPWDPDAQGVGTLARRLLAHAGQPAARVRICDYTNLAEQRTVHAAEVSFTGIDGERTIDIELQTAGDEHDLLGAMCHVIGAAWLGLRELEIGGADPYRGVVEVSDDHDEGSAMRASVAAVYLGFGIPSANAAHSARHGGYLAGNVVVTEWAVTMAGGLPVAAMVYLLAAS